MKKDYNPAMLPDVDEVEIVSLGGIHPPQVSGFIDMTVGKSGIKVTNNLCEQLCTFWRNLIPGEMQRCHTPPYELRFMYKSGGVLRASVCWVCNNIFLDDNGIRGGCTFDSSSKAAKDLLKYIRAIDAGEKLI